MKIEKFEDLEIWKLSIEIVKDIYKLTNKYQKFCRDFPLRDQIRKAAISISSNIAEGFERNYNKEFIRFLRIAKGSTGEVRCQLYLAEKIEYIDKRSFFELNSALIKLSRQTGQLIKYLKTL